MSRKVLYISSFAFAFIIALANYTVQFPINEWLTYGALAYPLSFLLTDILSERYSREDVLKVVKLGVLLAIVPTLLIADFRIALASIMAFFIVQQLDVHIFHLLKASHEKQWWLRNNASTMTSQLFDTTIFFMVAFAGVMPLEAVIKLIIGDYMIKLLIALLDTPLFYLIAIRGRSLLKRV